jgi:hypothetical protein
MVERYSAHSRSKYGSEERHAPLTEANDYIVPFRCEFDILVAVRAEAVRNIWANTNLGPHKLSDQRLSR